MTPVIVDVRTALRRVPLRRPWGETVRDIGVIPVSVTTDDGMTGHGFSWTPSIGATAVRALIDDDLAPFLRGRTVTPELWQQSWEHVHEAGGGGVTTIALAGVDLALWDAAAKRRDLPLADLLGRHHDRQPAYGSGVNLHYPLDELVQQAERWVAAGFTAVKVKIGRPDLADDLDRLAAVRDVLGPDRRLMVDANQRWTLDRALTAAAALEPLDIAWLEEPLRSDDTAGYRELRAASRIPIALGENVHHIHRFRDLIDAGAIDIVQPNVVRVGGITPFLAIADLVRDAGLVLVPHLLPELSAQLAFALPETTWVEEVEDAGLWPLGALAHDSGVTIADGWATGGRRPGLGLDFSTTGSTP